MSDIVKMLRQPYQLLDRDYYDKCIMAADEIERLEAEVERLQALLDAEMESNHRLGGEELRLRAALREIYEASGDDDDEKSQHYDWIKDTAKQALKDDSDG